MIASAVLKLRSVIAFVVVLVVIVVVVIVVVVVVLIASDRRSLLLPLPFAAAACDICSPQQF